MEWSNPIISGKYEYRRFAKSLWLKAFFHDMSGLDGFKNSDEVKLCNTATKYSILSELNSKMKQPNGKFEFILEYPELKKK